MRFGWMKRGVRLAIWAIAFIGLLAGCTADQGEQDPFLAEIEAAYPHLRGKTAEFAVVTRVVDGDTVELDNGAKVRLIGVNTPEVHGRTEYYGAEASAYTKSKLTGRKVVLYKDVSETDRYGRLLRYVFLYGDPVMFNERLVQEGYANAATYPPDVTFAERFVALEREARQRGVGLWVASDPDGQEAAGVKETASGAADAEGTAAEPPPASCDNPQIKGNINSKGEKIYHVPGGASYDVTKPEMMFCTEEEAVAAGFRKALR